MKPALCRECNAAIFFTLSPKGMNLPLDVATYEPPAEPPSRAPILYAVETDELRKDKPQARRWAPMDTLPPHISHFATCTNPARFSRRAS